MLRYEQNGMYLGRKVYRSREQLRSIANHELKTAQHDLYLMLDISDKQKVEIARLRAKNKELQESLDSANEYMIELGERME